MTGKIENNRFNPLEIYQQVQAALAQMNAAALASGIIGSGQLFEIERMGTTYNFSITSYASSDPRSCMRILVWTENSHMELRSDNTAGLNKLAGFNPNLASYYARFTKGDPDNTLGDELKKISASDAGPNQRYTQALIAVVKQHFLSQEEIGKIEGIIEKHQEQPQTKIPSRPPIAQEPPPPLPVPRTSDAGKRSRTPGLPEQSLDK